MKLLFVLIVLSVSTQASADPCSKKRAIAKKLEDLKPSIDIPCKAKDKVIDSSNPKIQLEKNPTTEEVGKLDSSIQWKKTYERSAELPPELRHPLTGQPLFPQTSGQ